MRSGWLVALALILINALQTASMAQSAVCDTSESNKIVIKGTNSSNHAATCDVECFLDPSATAAACSVASAVLAVGDKDKTLATCDSGNRDPDGLDGVGRKMSCK